MSNEVFPTFAGLEWDTIKTPTWKTKVQESVSGKELRTAYMAYPNWVYTLSYSVLRAATAYAELQQLAGFFNLRQGSFDSFLFTDPDDHAVTDFQFGTGDGATKNFQLIRTFGNFAEPVQNVNVLTNVKDAGTVKVNPTDYTISATGLVSFVTAPAAGHALTWTGTYYQRVRFMQDTADFTQFMKDLWTLKKLSFKTVKL